MGIEREVPRLEGEVRALGFAGLVAHGVEFLDGGGLVGLDEVVEELIDVGHVGGHAVLEHIVGEGVVAEELRHLAANVDDAAADVDVVGIVVVGALGVAGHIELAPQVAVVGVDEEGGVAGVVEGEHPSVEVALLGGLRCGIDGRLGQSAELGAVGEVEGVGLVLLQQVLRELQREHRGVLGELAQLGLAVVVEQCAAAYEGVVFLVEEHLFLGGEVAVMVVDGLYAGEELRVEDDVVLVLGEDGAELLGESLHLGRGVGAHEA